MKDASVRAGFDSRGTTGNSPRMVTEVTRSRVAVVVLNWNGCDDTLECLASLGKLDYDNFEVIVVDNGSIDNSVNEIQQKFPLVTLLQNQSNLGYAGGNNIGMRYALKKGVDYILVLNNDTVVARDALRALVVSAESSLAGAAFGAKVYFYAEPSRIWCIGGKWSNENLRMELMGYGETDDSNQYGETREVEIVVGCAMFLRASVLEKIGLFDEKFFLMHEESDWCLRAKEVGYKCVFVPSAKIWHKVSKSFGGERSNVMTYYNQRNILLWAEKHLSRMQAWRLFWRMLAILCRDAWQEVVPTFDLNKSQNLSVVRRLLWSCATFYRGLSRSWVQHRNRITSDLLGLRDYVLRRFGKCPTSISRL